MSGIKWRKSSYSDEQGGNCVEVGAAAWRKSTYSDSQGGACVEVASTNHAVAVRDSKDRTGPVLTFPSASWRAFLAGLQAGEFD